MPAVGCSASGPDASRWMYRQPEQVGDGWATASLADSGLDEARLALLMEVLRQNPGHLVHGIAIDRGFISSVDARVFDYFPELADLGVGRRGDITLRHLVTMSAGLQSGLTNVLGEVIRRASGLRLDEFSDRYLFAPLGITDCLWHMVRPDFVYASGDISLRPRDAAKLGQLYLQDGVWNGERLLYSEWIRASAAPSFATSEWMGHTGYGYGWWRKSPAYGADAFAAAGWGDQAIIVMPEHDMVAVFTGGS